MREGNPLILSTLEREGRFGSYHRRNAVMIAVALTLHASVIGTLLWVGWGALLFLLAAFALFLLLMGAFTALSSVGQQVRMARDGGAWDELLVTLLSDRELVNGLLMRALRPTMQLAWLASPSFVILCLAMCWILIQENGVGVGLLLFLGVLVNLALFAAVGALLILCIAVVSLQARLRQVGIIGRFVAAVVTLTPVVFAPFALIFLVSMFLGTWRMLWVVGPLGLLSIFLLPFPLLCFAIPGLCWYQYRILCCTLRGRLLEGR